MIFTDTHAHLYAPEFDEDRDEMMQRAFETGVQRFFIPAIDSESVPSMYKLEALYPAHVFLMAGLHPCYVKENYKTELAFVEQQLKERKFVAIGEIGIDLYWDKSTLEIQKEAFKFQIQLAKKHKLPIVIHCRASFDEIFEVLESEKSDDLFGIFHCFSGNYDEALRAISYGMKLGIGGVFTFKNGNIDKFIQQIDLKHLVLETDAPYLAPVPYRGKRNESSYLVEISKKLATIFHKSPEEIALITTENSKAIFGI